MRPDHDKSGVIRFTLQRHGEVYQLDCRQLWASARGGTITDALIELASEIQQIRRLVKMGVDDEELEKLCKSLD